MSPVTKTPREIEEFKKCRHRHLNINYRIIGHILPFIGGENLENFLFSHYKIAVEKPIHYYCINPRCRNLFVILWSYATAANLFSAVHVRLKKPRVSDYKNCNSQLIPPHQCLSIMALGWAKQTTFCRANVFTRLGARLVLSDCWFLQQHHSYWLQHGKKKWS